MAYGNPRGGRAWYPEKRSPGSRDRRFWDLGADLNPDGALRIYRKACGANAAGNKGLVIHQMDTETNAEGLEIIHESAASSSAYPLVFRREADGTAQGYIDISDGDWATASSAEFKENFKDVPFKVLEKIATKLPVKSWNFTDSPEARLVGPTAEDFREITGYGNGKSVNKTTFMGITFRIAQILWNRVMKLEQRLEQMNASEALKKNKDAPEV